jgi:hypothetical protein
MKWRVNKKALFEEGFHAGPTGLEPATFGLTGRCANQLHHDPTFRILENKFTTKIY